MALVEHMGDIVAAEPVSRLARSTFPNARIEWPVRQPYAALPSGYADVDGTVAVQCLTEWLLLWSYGAYDVVWDLHLSERSCPVCNASFQKPGEAAKVVDATYYKFGNLLHIQCLCAGLEPIAVGPVLPRDPNSVRIVDALDLPPRFIVIHAKSNDDSRDWTRAKWLDLLSHLTGSHDAVVVEIGVTPYIITSDQPQQRSVVGKLSLLETAEVIRRAVLFIGIDSGPAHLANAVATPGVVLLGRYRVFQSYMPYSGFYASEAGATILRADGPVAGLPASAVVQAVDRRLSDRS